MERKTICRYLREGTKGQCTAEAVDPQGEIILCFTHLARAIELIQRKGREQA
jgi:hypothetical protein